MALTVYNSYQAGQPNGTAITQGNSGGTAGIAWDSVSTGTGGSAVYSTSSPFFGTESGLYTVGATSAAARTSWTGAGALGGSFTRLQGTIPVQPITSLPTVQTAFARFTSGGSQSARFSVMASGAVSLRDSSSGSITGATSSGTMTTSSKWIVKFDITFGSTGSGDIWIWYNGTGVGTADEHLTFTTSAFLSGAIDGIDFGIAASTTNTSIKLGVVTISDQFPGTFPPGPVVQATASATLGGLSDSGAGHVGTRGTASAALGGLTGSGAGRLGRHGSGAAALGGLAGSAAGQKNNNVTIGAGAAHLGGLTGSAAGTKNVLGTAHASLGGLSAGAIAPLPRFFFTPPTRKMVTSIQGALRYSYLVSETVWKDGDGVWQHMETPPTETLLAASRLLSVSGRPEYVDEATAEELIAAGIGTITIED